MSAEPGIIIRVAVFEDNIQLLESLRQLIDNVPELVCTGAFPDAKQLERKIEKSQPDVVMMDIDMPGMNGIEAVKLIRINFPEILIIMQTVFDDDDKIFNSIRAGASGYFLKKTDPEKLIEGVREVVHGGAPMTASVARRILNFFNEQTTLKASDPFNLSAREIEVLNFLVKGYSQKMIAGELNISRFTVNNHLAKIYEKLHVHNASEAVATALNKKIVNPGI